MIGVCMCLGIAIRRPQHVLATGEHCGLEWMVIQNGGGYRCGYIRVPAGHPWHGKGYDDIDADVHGGLTFAEPDEQCDKGGDDSAHWFGFDCAHWGDAPDPSLEMDEFVRSRIEQSGGYGRVRDQKYVENECRKLCEQAAACAASSLAGRV